MRIPECRRIAAWGCAVALICGAALGCASEPGIPHPAPAAAPVAPPPVTGPVSLSGWKLTLPVVGKKGDAAGVDPAAPTPPWLVAARDGGLTLWAPVAGSTTPNSSHTRTELDSLTAFLAGVGRHVPTATVAVSQLPREKPDVIVGQIHGADALSSIPFVMVHDDGGTIMVVVKAATVRTRQRPISTAGRGPARYPRPVHDQRRRRRQPHVHRHQRPSDRHRDRADARGVQRSHRSLPGRGLPAG